MAVAEYKAQQVDEFLQIVGDEVDPSHARAALDCADWNLEVALNMFMEGAVPDPAVPAPAAVDEEPSSEEEQVNAGDEEETHALANMSVQELRSLLDALEVDHTGCREKADLVDLLNTAMLGAGLTKRQSPSQRMARPEFRPPRRTGPSSAATDEQARVNAERREEIAMQDAEFQESLLIDQQREELRMQAEEEERRLEQAKTQAAHDEHLKLEAKRARLSQAEPDKAHPDRCQIVVRTPAGPRLSRTFLESDDASFLYDWVDVACNGEAFTKNKYLLVSRLPGQPSKELPNSLSTLKDLGVEHQTMFFITVVD